MSDVAQLGGQLLNRMDHRAGLTSIVTKVSRVIVVYVIHTYVIADTLWLL